jgi:ring-1,2-phenylacetyl-CoA epoxidase subunit PaaA
MRALIYEREPEAFKYPYAFDVPLDSWHELVMANALYDQAGFVLLSDVHRSSTFGPWKRALAKVDKEETFHLRHGRTWVKKLCADPAEKARIQAAADWMFILTLEWFGLPDERKRHGIQLEYGFKGMTNDELRQTWMAAVVPFMDEVGIEVPAHWDADDERWVIDCPFPARFDEDAKRWLLDDGPIGWDEVVTRWKARGPMNRDYVERLQRGYRSRMAAA